MLIQRETKPGRPKLAGLAVLLFMAILASACSQTREGPIAIERAMDELVGNEPKPAPAPAEITGLLFQGQAGQVQERQHQERFDVSVNNIPARTFFLSLVADSGVNVVAHPEVSGLVSLELKNVTVDEVLDVTRDVYGYQYKYVNGIYTIYPRKIRTEIFHINYLDVERSGSTDTNVLIGAISSKSSNGQGGQQAASSQKTNEQVSGSRVKTVNKTNFWKLLQQTLAAIVGDEQDGRTVIVNPQAGLVVVKAMPSEIHSVRQFLEKSELSVRRQVILETKILEVKLFDGFEAGVNWSQIQGQLHYSNNVSSYESPADILDVGADVGEVFASIFRVNDIQDLLSLLETQGSVQVLSSPRVSTVNNQKAVIRVGSDEFFVTGISSNQTSTASSTTTTPNIELTSFFSGISLDVTPQIAENGDVILHVHPIVSEVVDQIKDFTVGDEEFSLPMALRDIRESDSIVRAQSGQVVVLGGLMKEAINEVTNKKPLLGDVPGLNALFRSKQSGSSKSELVILMRPVIVDEGDWQQDINASRSRIKELSRLYNSR